MYAWIWRHLPGPTWLKLIETLIILAIIVFLLMQYVFPPISARMPYNDVSV